jgi:hypothetical protein
VQSKRSVLLPAICFMQVDCQIPESLTALLSGICLSFN